MYNNINDSEFIGVRNSVAIWDSTLDRAEKLAELITLSGCNLVDRQLRASLDFLLIEVCSKTEQLPDFLSEILRYLESNNITALGSGPIKMLA